MSTVNCKL